MMRNRPHRALGLTLIEMTLVIATMALLVGFALPAVRSLVHSFQSEGAVKSMIDAALSSARAMAMSRQTYVGVRFQKQYSTLDASAPLQGLLEAPQYMIFIMHDPDAEPNGTGYADGFRAFEGVEPIKLPDSFAVMDLMRVERVSNALGNQITFSEGPLNVDLDSAPELARFAARLRDTTTFSVVFSPAGRLVVHGVRVWNRHGRRAGEAVLSTDQVFNAPAQVVNPNVKAMFYQDDFPPETGLGPESSRTRFVVFEKTSLREACQRNVPWKGYLERLSTQPIYVSPYTGRLISAD